jgi:hypothetical protein
MQAIFIKDNVNQFGEVKFYLLGLQDFLTIQTGEL